jgi:hypothetical protein
VNATTSIAARQQVSERSGALSREQRSQLGPLPGEQLVDFAQQRCGWAEGRDQRDGMGCGAQRRECRAEQQQVAQRPCAHQQDAHAARAYCS